MRGIGQTRAMARVIVVGAGVIGLSCAVRLLERGHRVDVLARELPLETTSVVAAALWYPFRAYPQDKVAAWSEVGYRELAKLAGVAGSGVRMMVGSELLRVKAADPWWAGAVPGLTRVDTPPEPYVDGWAFTAPVVDMPVYLRWLAERVRELDGTITRLAMAQLPDGADVVVDASGLGARLLADDRSVTPVRGQVLYVEQVGLDQWWLDGSGLTYVVPRAHEIVVGGTEEEGVWNLSPDPAVAARILQRATALVPALAGARVLRQKVGLRPGRPAVRLEEQRVGSTRVVHCYGHGGAGVTLSWGCAADVAALV